MMMATPALQLAGLTRRFGGVVAVDNISVTIPKGEIVGLVGPNGSGKTTLVNLVTGFVPKNAGQVLFEGRDISHLPPHEIARSGVARTFQIVQPFAEMTVLQNVMAGALFAGQRGTMKEAADKAHHYLTFVGLDRFAGYSASELSLADRKRLELAKSLAMEPRLLFLDEVNAGLNSSEIDSALQLIRNIAGMGITIVIIEHVLRIVLSLVKRLVVLHHGAMLSDGPPADVLNDPAVIKAYLGTKFGKRHQAELEQRRAKYQQDIERNQDSRDERPE
jgi:branched-chain amino acid transport system ATP-binding protein